MENIDQLLQTTKIYDKFIDVTTKFDEPAKQYLKQKSKFIRDFLTMTQKPNSYQLRTLTNELLSYWNESITCDTENFWTELRKNNIDIKRKQPLKFALTKKRFRTVEQGIDARNNWGSLKKEKSITDNYSQIDIQLIDKIIADDERKRLDLLNKSLVKEEIPQSQYLKFGECMAYFSRCNLFDKYFSKEQVDKLHFIWKNFKVEIKNGT